MIQEEARHALFMQAALAQAQQAAALGEVPVGAVLVRGNEIIAAGHNRPVSDCDPCAHAEIVALRAAAQRLGNYRLEDCTLYVTLEPCTMCAGAMLNARLAEVIYAVSEPKTGAAGSVINPFTQASLNHQTRLRSGAELGVSGQRWAAASTALLQAFFRLRREASSHARKSAHPLRQDALRPPAAGWDAWPQWQRGRHAHSCYVQDLPSLDGLRLHYLQAQTGRTGLTWLLLHGHPGWSACWEHTMTRLLALPDTARVLVPDLIGFGLSDKPKKAAVHSPDWHRQVLLELAQACDLQDTVIMAQGVGADLATALPAMSAGRWRGFWALPQGQQATPATLKSTQQTVITSYAPEVRELTDIARRGLRASCRAAHKLHPDSLTNIDLLQAAWPDAGHQAVFSAVASWYAPSQPCPSWLQVPAAVRCLHSHDIDGPANLHMPLWKSPDELLDSSTLQRAAAYFSS